MRFKEHCDRVLSGYHDPHVVERPEGGFCSMVPDLGRPESAGLCRGNG